MISYTVLERDGGAKSYECQMCGVSSTDLDAARAHHASHVAGPDLLSAAKALLVTRGAIRDYRGKNGEHVVFQDLIRRTKDAGDLLEIAVAKAEPKG